MTNSQIIQKPLYLDNPPPKSSLPPIQPFKRHVHVPNQAREKHTSGHSGTAERESDSDSICLALKGKLSEVWFISRIEYSKNPCVRIYILCSSCILGTLLCVSRKYPYPPTDGHSVLTPSPPWNFHSRGSVVDPPTPQDFPFFFVTFFKP